MNSSTTGRGSVLRAVTVSAAAIVLSATCAATAKAACPSSFRAKVSGVAWSDGPAARRGLRDATVVRAAYLSESEPSREPSIVGLWKIAFLDGGQVIDEGFDAWHGDGTETLNDSVPPTAGNVCLGIWEQTGRRTYQLKHLSWNYDAAGTAIGIVIIHERVTLDRSGNNYRGTTTFDVYDMNKNLLFEGSGEVTGRRITVHDSFF
jgi:hypothetical protein